MLKARLSLDSERCKGCLLCTAVCKKGMLRKGGSYNGSGYYHVVLEDEGRCNGCALCAEICPDVAIMVWK
ncbi:MAG: 4Fe-4S binding protein [Nitrospirae bacterium]|nr:4Fe-4S binding protein [Nitrospirota bacterium]MBI5694375.1 4Fe-4S binding protein [Nitrospirota bacterium]